MPKRTNFQRDQFADITPPKEMIRMKAEALDQLREIRKKTNKLDKR